LFTTTFATWLAYLELGAHFLDLRALFFEQGCESLYLFLLLRDGCFQLLNFANFAIGHGVTRTRLRRATLHGCGRRGANLIRTNNNIPAKVIIRKV